MPPIPNTISGLTQRLTALSDQNKATNHLIQRLAKLDFQPGSLPLDSSSEENGGDPRLELSAEIHENLKGIEEELELLSQEVEDIVNGGGTGFAYRRRDSEKERERSRLAVLLARLTEDLKISRSQFRKAQVAAKRSADAAKRAERALLFTALQSGSSTPNSSSKGSLLAPRKATTTSHTSQATADEVIATASSDVTAALRRTHQLMQSELLRSRFAQETLENSTKALEELGQGYAGLNDLLKNTRSLVGTLLSSQKSDSWYLETAFWILVTTILWLVFRRWFYGPLRYFVWFPIKLFYKLVLVPLFAVTGLTAKGAGQTSTSLIVKPSATGPIPTRVVDPIGQKPYVKVGVGGGNRGWGFVNDPSVQGSLSQQVGQMAEQQRQSTQSAPNQQPSQEGPIGEQDAPEGQNVEVQEEDEEVVRRGDGTVLPKRPSDKPPNPKKKMWEEDVESERYEAKRADQQVEASAHRKRDEL